MVRLKVPPTQLTVVADSKNMECTKCKQCDLALNRKGENRPGVRCKDCKKESCAKCADVTAEFCKVVRTMGKEMWCCSDCESKTAVMKSVLEKIETLHTEMVDIKKGQEGQQAEQERVLEGIKVVETVVKRMEGLEKVQAEHGEKLVQQEASIRKNYEKIDQTELRTTAIEKRLETMKPDTVNVLQTNAIVRELRQMESNERNIVICNVPESSEEEAEDRKKEDEKKISEIFKELNIAHIKPVNVIRIGFGGRYPKKTLVILRSTDDSEKIIENAERITLANDVWLTRDRTWNQREEARLLREEKQKQEAEGVVPQKGKGPVGRPRGSGKGSMRGRGSRLDDTSRKRRRSGDEDSAKWRRTGERGRGRGDSRGAGGGVRGGRGGVGGGRGRGGGVNSQIGASDQTETGTSEPGPSSENAAAGAAAENF